MTQSRASSDWSASMPTIHVAHRRQVFVAPGVMLMRVPTPTGEQELQPATDWGVSYKLFNFNLPGVRRQGTLHVNLVRAWVFTRVGRSAETRPSILRGSPSRSTKPTRLG